MINQGFSGFQVKQLVKAGDILGSVEIIGGEKQRVNLLAGASFSFSLAKDESPTLLLSGSGFAYAPVAAGEQAGVAYVCLGEMVIGKIPLVYEETVEIEKTQKKPFWDRWFS